MLVWTLLTVSWHQDNLARKTDFPWRTFIIQSSARSRVSRRGHTDLGPGNSGKQTLAVIRRLWERRSDIKTENCYTVAIITSEVNIPNTLGRDPCSHSSPVNCRIPCGERRASKAARSQKSRTLGKLFSSARTLGPGQATSCEYCDPDPKHKPDPGLGFHFQFLNSLSHQLIR